MFISGFWLLLLVSGGVDTYGQRVYEVEFEAEADLLMYLTDQESEADLVVFMTQYQSDARRDLCDGIWYRTPFSSQADISYMMTSYRSQADLVISYSPYRSQAMVSGRACDAIRSAAGASESRSLQNKFDRLLKPDQSIDGGFYSTATSSVTIAEPLSRRVIDRKKGFMNCAYLSAFTSRWVDRLHQQKS